MSDLSDIDKLQDAGRDAHALVSIAGNVGAVRVSEFARDFEIACKGMNLAAARQTIPALRSAIDLSSDALGKWLNR